MTEQDQELRILWKEVCVASIRGGRNTCITDANSCVEAYNKAFNISSK